MNVMSTFLVVVLLFLLIQVYIGWRGYKQSAGTVEDYFVAKGRIGTLVLFWTMYATSFSAWTFLGMTGASYSHGLGWFVMAPTSAALGLSMILIGPAVNRWGSKFGYITPTELLQHRFNSRGLGLLIAAISVLGVVPYAAIQIMGIGYAFEGMTGGAIPFLGGTVLFLVFLAVYTIFGGFRAVAWTDTLQGIVLFVCLWIGLSRVLQTPEVGGLATLVQELAQRVPSPLGLPGQAGYFTYTTWVSWFFLLIPGMVAYPWIVQRFFAARNVEAIKKSAALMPVLALLTALPPLLVGLSAIRALPDLGSPDLVMTTMLARYVGALLGSILGVGAIAAAMSTIDSILLTMGSIITRDIISVRWPNLHQNALLKWARISVGAWVVVCLAIAVWRPTLIALLGAYDLQFIGLGLFVPLLAAIYWRRATSAGIISGMVTGQLAGLIAAFVWNNPFGLGFDPVLWGYIVQVPVLIGVSLATAPPGEDHLAQFFDEDPALLLVAEEGVSA